jgi:Flp pilus assembly protein TadD
VSEPYVDGAVRPDILFPAYLKGLNLAESFYLATPSLSWQTVVIGDPLCAPFRSAAFGDSQAEPPVDADTELPAHFSARRLAALQGLATTPALKLVLRAETRNARGDSEGALDALKKASTADSASTFVWHALAAAHERRGQHAESAAGYRQILELNGTDVVALNNLAYNLTVHDSRPRDAYPYAARAAALAKNNPTVDDTFGWIQHLLGDNAQALVLLERASRLLPNNAEVQFHAAVVSAAAGRVQEAGQLLKAALALDPSLGRRPDVRDLQQALRVKH